MPTLGAKGDYRSHILDHYNHHAYFYDLTEFFRRGARRTAMRLSGWRPGEKVLDVCTGTGEMALTFASEGANVVGIDLARAMVKRATNKSLGSGLSCAWLEMEATNLAFADNSFEISVVSLVLHHMPFTVQVRVLRELRRVTCRRIVIIEPHTPSDPRWFRLWASVVSLIDESELLHEWVHQDFVNTCHLANLRVESVHVISLARFRITVCDPVISTVAS